MPKDSLQHEIEMTSQEIHFAHTRLTICYFSIGSLLQSFQSGISTRNSHITHKPKAVSFTKSRVDILSDFIEMEMLDIAHVLTSFISVIGTYITVNPKTKRYIVVVVTQRRISGSYQLIGFRDSFFLGHNPLWIIV